MKKTYKTSRQTTIEKEIEEITIGIEVTVASEDVLVSVTRDGYIKRTSLRSYTASNGKDFAIKDDDHLISMIEMNTTDDILLFTNRGNYLYLPVHKLPDIRWKDIGQHISNLVTLEQDEFIIQCIPIRQFDDNHYLIFITENGMIKKSKLKDYEAKTYTRPLIAIKLNKGDQVIQVLQTDGNKEVFIASNVGYGLWFHESELKPIGIRASGVKSIDLKTNEKVISGQVFTEEEKVNLIAITQRGACKRMKLNQFEKSNRARRGSIMLRELKNKPHRLRGFFMVTNEEKICFRTTEGQQHTIEPLGFSISDRYSNGSFIIDSDHDGEVSHVWKKAIYEQPFREIENN